MYLHFLFVLSTWASQCQQPPLKQEAQVPFKVWGFYVYDLIYKYDSMYPTPPYTLKLQYKRDLSGKSIVDRTQKEILGLGAPQEKTSKWIADLRKIIPDIKKGDALVGMVDSKKKSVFCLGEKLMGEIEDPEFADYFFGIWLSEKTSEPKLRKKLLNSAKPI